MKSIIKPTQRTLQALDLPVANAISEAAVSPEAVRAAGANDGATAALGVQSLASAQRAGERHASLPDRGEAANDNVTIAPPPSPQRELVVAAGIPGSTSEKRSGPPLVWSAADPAVVALRAEICAARTDTTDLRARRVATSLIDLADGNGELPSYGGKPALKAFRKSYGLPKKAVALGEPARELFERFAPRFRLESHETVFTSRSGYKNKVNHVAVVRDHIATWKRDGILLPAVAEGTPCIRSISKMMGVDYFKLRTNRVARGLLQLAVDEGDLMLGPVVAVARDMLPEQRDARLAELKAVVLGFDVPGGKIPESAARSGIVDWDHIASLTGKSEPTLQYDQEYRRFVNEVKQRRGLMPPGLMVHDDTITAFTAWGLEHIAAENAGKVSVDAIVANHKAAINRFAGALEVTPEDLAGPMFEPEKFDGNLAVALSTFANPRSAANFRRMVIRWRDLHAARLGAAELPDDVQAALDTVLRMRGVTPSKLAHLLGVRAHVIQRIVSSEKTICKADIDILRRAEIELALPTGTLLMKVKEVLTKVERMGAASPAYRALATTHRALLPDTAAFWPEDRLAAAVQQVQPLLSCGTEYGRRCSLARRALQRMPAFEPSSRLRAQLAEYRAYKCAPVTFPLIRPTHARWKKQATAQIRMASLELMFRFMAAPVDNGSASGLGIGSERATIAWLGHAPFALAHVAQRAARFLGGEGEAVARGRVYTVAERDFLAHLVSMTNPVTGYLVQHPWLASELVRLEARLALEHAELLKLFGLRGEALLLTEDDVAYAQRDWTGYLGRQHQALLGGVAHLDDVLEVSRSPIVPIRGIIEASEPEAELMRCILQAETRWASERVNAYNYRIDVRDAVMHRLAALTALRPSNLATLGYTGDETGEIRKIDGQWSIRINYRKFKNFKSSRLFGTSTARRDYEIALPSEGGLSELLDLYFHEVRTGMLVSEDSGAAFVSKNGVPMTVRSWYDVVRAFGIKHIAYNPVLGTGIPGVTSMSPYAFRHIRASDILKNGLSANRLEEAAFALQTSEDMVRKHYGFLMPKAAIVSANATFARAVQLALRRRT